ncbi:MAG: hypothetical protein ACLGHN_00870 [Bacteriovoracia bacterium]
MNLRKQNEAGLQQDLIARFKINRKFDIGAQGTYLERFDLYEDRVGAFVTARPLEGWTFEARYLQGMGNRILPEKELNLSVYHSFALGLSPFLYYRDARYSLTHLHAVNVGMEIEKIPNLIIIPSFMGGKATFKDPAETESVYSFGLRVIWYKEAHCSFSAFSYKGKEASQAVIGRSSELVDTLSGGLSAAWYFSPEWRAELVFDHTDYDELQTEFHTTTLNLSRMF